ncbi:23S rRNA (guanosine(2251)-2'-O)-methyltransferase [hydrothermal vent metagenome]|uniref:23S rRNA (Guanosine(2251)-2'-O)-methyltransferase n=1 Tax=hydrothermal vent metagenome TaxID=652676 RepID=A0A3B1B4C0_9ZZZZ
MSDSQIIAGLHSVRTALQHEGAVTELWIEARRHDRRIKEILQLAREAGLQANRVPRDELDALASNANHQGVVARTKAPASLDEAALKVVLKKLDVPPFLLVLDGVQDPHNLGACLRSADAAGVHAVIAPKDRSVGLGPTVCKVACGAAESVHFVQVTNLARTLRWLQDDLGVWLTGMAGEAEASLFDADLKGPLALVLGGEEKGMRRLTREACDVLVKLPMAGEVESLNVSVATGIALYEAVRQRLD